MQQLATQYISAQKKNRGIITFIFQRRIFFVELWQEEGL